MYFEELQTLSARLVYQMNGLSLIAADRRFRWYLPLSALVTMLGLGLLGRMLEPRPEHDPTAALHPMRVAIMPTPPPPKKPVVVPHVAPKPVKKIPPRPVIVKHPIPHVTHRHIVPPLVHPRRATLRRASPRPNPLRAAHPAAPGGASSAAPVMASPVTPPTVAPPKSATRIPVVTTSSSQVTVPLVPPSTIDTPTIPALPPAPVDSGGRGTSAGQGTDSGVGQGHGSGEGAGTGTGGGPFGIGSGGTGTGEGPRHVVYVLDLSGSMTSRIDRAREELRNSMADLQPGETFDIITFSDEVHFFDYSMDPASPFMIQRADYYLTTLQVRGGTNLEGALTAALRMKDVNVIYLITDGVPTEDMNGLDIPDPDRYMRRLPRAIREHNINNARIYTIGLVGKDPDGRDESFAAAGMLAQIAHDSGGVSKVVPLGVPAP
jgi:hypothetical protein